jgi:twinkle protein
MEMLGPAGVRFLEGRGIPEEIAVRFEIHTATRRADDVIPSETGSIIAFPYLEHGRAVAEKYRTFDKKFWQRPGGKKTFWNADVLDDPALQSGQHALVITEGELDAITAIVCDIPFAVSVPDGAPAEVQKDFDPTQDNRGKFEFVWNNRDRLKHIKRFIIAVDNDDAGKALAAELVRRLSAVRCFFVAYPDGCKDLNDVLMKHGADVVRAVINNAKPYPVRGLYRLVDYPEAGALETFASGWPTLDKLFRMFLGEFMVVTGIPSHGKSSFVLHLLVNMAEMHGWRMAIFSPEMPVVPQMRDKLRRIKDRSAFPKREADMWINDHFVFIDSDPTGDEDEDFDLQWVIARAIDAVLRDGINVLVIDPWNELDHARRKDETVTDYVGRSIRELKRFARLYNVAVIVVAHPTKEVGKEGKHRHVTLYDIESSAHWFNKCDHGIVVERPDPSTSGSTISIAKSRFEEAGEKGSVKMTFNRNTSRFEMLAEIPEGEF